MPATHHDIHPARTAKLFRSGGSQAVRLPSEFRFEGDEVHIWRDELSGNVVLSERRRVTWAEFTALRDQLAAEVLQQYMKDRHQPASHPHPASIDGAA